MLTQFVEIPSVAATCASLRIVVSGADTLAPELVDRFFALLPECELHNQYGPTEATVTTTYWRCAPGAGESIVPIGHPIAGTSVYVLDEKREPVPTGMIGEIYIAGAGVAEGYRNRPDQTAARFLPDLNGPGTATVYRTGDLGRIRPDGALEFHGRADRQLNVRGYRVEPGEIEAALTAHPAVQETAVVSGGSGSGALVAHIGATSGEWPSAPELREHLARELPAYLMPTHYLLHDQLPRVVSGKIDYGALPEPPGTRPELTVAFAPPADPLQERVARIWSQVLNVDPVGVNDNFLELGGHSLLAIKVATRIRETCHRELPATAILEYPTIDEVVRWMREQTSEGPKHAVVPGPLPVDRTRPIPLSYQQEQIWFLSQLLPDSIAYATQAYLDLHGPVSLSLLEDALAEIVRRHEHLRTAFVEINGEPCQVIGEPFRPEIRVIDLTGLPVSIGEVRALDLMESFVARPFDVGAPPLFRWVMFRLADDRHLLLLVEHHFIHDGWSFGVLMSELRECYRAFADGTQPRLPPLPIQFGDYAVWQREWMKTSAAREQLDFWQANLAGAAKLLPLPTDRPRPRIQSHHGDAVLVPLPPGLYEKIRLLGAGTSVTGYMAMMAIFKVLLYCRTEQADLTVAVSVANRRHESTERLIGMIINEPFPTW